MSRHATPYSALFADYVMRALHAALEAIAGAGAAPGRGHLADDVRERGLHALSYGLRLPKAWPQVRNLMLALARPLELQGYRRDWMDLLERGIELAQKHGDVRANIQLHLHVGKLQILLGHYEMAGRSLQAGLALAEHEGERILMIDARNRLAELALHRCFLVEARSIAEATLALLAPDDPLCMSSYRTLGHVAMRAGDLPHALAHFLTALNLAMARQHEDLAFAQLLRDVGAAYIFMERQEEALALLGRARQIASGRGDHLEVAIIAMVYGLYHWRRGEFEAATACYDRAATTFLTYGNLIWLARNNNNRGLLLQAMGEYGRAEAVILKSIEQARTVNDACETANALDTLATCLLQQGRVDEARGAWGEALATIHELPEPPHGLLRSIRHRLAALGATG